MNQQYDGSDFSTPSIVPMKRKRGRPRKDSVKRGNIPLTPFSGTVLNSNQISGTSCVKRGNIPLTPYSGTLLNSNQTAGTSCDGEMLGKVVTGVIEGTFSAGYLLHVKIADTDIYLRGVVFLPGQVAPVTAENDVAPHLKMIKRKKIPIPVHNPGTHAQSSDPSSGQFSKQPFDPELLVPKKQRSTLPRYQQNNLVLMEEQQKTPKKSASINVVPTVQNID